MDDEHELLWKEIMPLEWDQEKYSTGYAHIDEQHYELFNGLNSLIVFLKDPAKIEQQEAQEKAVELINFLGEYAASHFRDEEELFDKSDHPLKELNKEAHQRFIAKYADYKNKLSAGAVTRGSLIQLHIFLQSWLITHILKVDISLRDCAAKEEAGQAPPSDFTKQPSVFARFLALFQKNQEAD